MATAAQQAQIIRLVVGTVGASPGADILAELEAIIDGGATFTQLANALVANPAYETIYASSLTNAAFSSAFMTDILGGDVTAELLQEATDIGTGLLNAGTTRGDLMSQVIEILAATATTDPVLGAAAQALANKVEVATYYSVTTGLSSESLTTLQGTISAVNSSAGSVDAAKLAVDAMVNAGTTYELTTGADTLVGTALNDTFNAAVSGLSSANTLNVTDTIDGGAGNDTLAVSLASGFTGFTTGAVTNVETIALANSGVISRSFDASGITGATAYTVDGDKGVSIADLASGVSYTLSNVSKTGSSSVSATFATAATETLGTADVANVKLNSVGLVYSASGAHFSTTVDLASIETINVESVGSNYINLDGGSSAYKTINVTGSGNLTVDAVDASTTTFDSTASTGNVTANVTAATALSTIALGVGDDSLTMTTANVPANATLAGGAGADKLTLDSLAKTVQYTMTGFETLALNNVTGALLFAGTNTSGLTNVTHTTTTTAAVSLVNMGAGSLTFTGTGITNAGGTIASDHTGATTVNYVAGSTATTNKTAEAPLATYTFSGAAGALTIKNGAYIANTASTITANKASSVALTVDSGKDTSAVPVEITQFNSTITAPVASSVTVNATGQLGAAAAITAAKATSAIVTNGASTGNLALTAASATNLTVSTGNTLTLTGDLTAVQTATLSTSKGALSLAATALSAVNNLNATGAGTTSAVTLGNLGLATQDYGMSVTASGLMGGFTAGNIAVGTGYDINLNVAGVTGAVVVGTIGGNAKNVVIDAQGVVGAVTLDAITATGDVNLKLDNTIGAVTLGAIVGKTVTVDASNTIGGVVGTTYGVTAGSTADIAVSALELSAINLAASATATSLTAVIAGGIAVDTLTVTFGGTDTKTVTITGDLGLDADVVVINNAAYTSGTLTNIATIDISGLLNYDTSTLNSSTTNKATVTGGAGADTITGGNLADTLNGGAGNDIITGGGDADIIDGGTGNDVMNGGAGDDTITSSSGTNTFNGGAGADKMTAGSGVDTFVFAAGVTDTVAAAASIAGVDKITGLNLDADKIQLTVAVAAVGAAASGALNSATFIADMNAALTVATKGFVTTAAGIDAAIVTGTSGTLLGRSFLAVDLDFSDTFTATDFVIEVTGVTGTIDIADFII